jgi:hypothetical protein
LRGRSYRRCVAKAVSQLLGPYKDREESFSLGENHEGVPGFGLDQLRNRCSDCRCVAGNGTGRGFD